MDAGELGTTAAIATFLVPFVSLIKRPTWGRKLNTAISMAASMVAAIAGAAIDGKLTGGTELLSQFGVAFATSQVVYQLYFRDSDINEKLESKGA